MSNSTPPVCSGRIPRNPERTIKASGELGYFQVLATNDTEPNAVHLAAMIQPVFVAMQVMTCAVET